MTTYCDFAPGHPFHGPYHDREYGFPVHSDDALFERLVLEMNQAGLSWLTILKKREAFRDAFKNFEIARVARMRSEPLLKNAGIIRNRLKIDAAIENADGPHRPGAYSSRARAQNSSGFQGATGQPNIASARRAHSSDWSGRPAAAAASPSFR